MKRIFIPVLLCLAHFAFNAHADAVWQWSTPVADGRAFLWIPEKCRHVRAVVVGENNMIEQGILERGFFRKEMARLGIAEIFIAPPSETWQNATNNDAANEKFNALLQSLADDSGYAELKFAPIIPMGHSAMASFPWNFAAWNPRRTLAMLSIHGDAPQTTLTGNGRPNLNWGDRNIDGIPGLMVMGEYEWWEDRLTPLFKFLAAHPASPIAMLAEPGRGHFDYSDDLVKFLALFIRKAAEARLPENFSPGEIPVLKPIQPRDGWLVQRWTFNQPRTVKPAPFEKYSGDKTQAFWAFDKETAWAIQNYRANQIGKLPQLLGYVQDGKIVPQVNVHQQVNLKFEPDADGVTFHQSATFLNFVDGGSKNTTRWTDLPADAPIGHASRGKILVSHIAGPFVKISDDIFRVQFDRVASTTDRRNADLWFLAEHPGDAKYKSAVQQALMKLPAFNDGAEQRITFGKIADQKIATKELKLNATSSSGRPVYFYVREGPAEIDGDVLHFTRIPPHAKLPIRITIVAWQLGCAKPKMKTAEPVTQEFWVGQ
jgi:hypothetical protein